MDHIRWGDVLDRKTGSVLLASFLGPLAGNMILALVPTLRHEFSASAPEVLLSITFFMVPFAIFMLFSGAFSDVYDRRRTLIVGFAVYAVGSVLCAISVTLSFFLAARVVQGIGFAFITPVLVAILGDITPYEERGRWMGFMASATAAGVAMGPFLGGVTAEVSWRLAFVLVAALTVMVGVLFWLSFRGYEFERGRGSVRSVLSNLRVCAVDRDVLFLSIAGFLAFLGYIGPLSFLSDTLSLPPLELRESEIGMIIMLAGVASIFSAPVGGKLVDRAGRFATAFTGFSITSLSLVLLVLSSTPIHHALSLLVLGAGVAIVWSSLLTLSVEVLPNLKGTVSSLFNSSRFLGYALAPMAFAPVYTAIGMDAIYLVGIALAMVGIVSVWMIRPQKTE